MEIEHFNSKATICNITLSTKKYVYFLCFTDPTWASINRGVLICDECCSVHRSLGRHISQIKSLNKGQWSPTLLSVSILSNIHVHGTCGNE